MTRVGPPGGVVVGPGDDADLDATTPSSNAAPVAATERAGAAGVGFVQPDLAPAMTDDDAADPAALAFARLFSEITAEASQPSAPSRTGTFADLNASRLSNADDADAFCAEALHAAFTRARVAHPVATCRLELARTMWSRDDFRNQRGLVQNIETCAAFAAQLVLDAGSDLPMRILLIPRGDLTRTSGAGGEALYVPLNRGYTEVGLREAYDRGDFIPTPPLWRPFSRSAAEKQRRIWQLVENPVSSTRARMTRLFREGVTEIVRGIERVLNASEGAPPLLDRIRALLRDTISSTTPSRSGGNFLQEVLAALPEDEGALRSLVTAWKHTLMESRVAESAADGAMAAIHRIEDRRRTFGIINVDTLDSIAVAPPPDAQRHGQIAVNHVTLEGLRVGLINVSSTDVVTVLPNLARMILGGLSLERSLDR